MVVADLKEIPKVLGNWTLLTKLNFSHCASFNDILKALGNLTFLIDLGLSDYGGLKEIP